MSEAPTKNIAIVVGSGDMKDRIVKEYGELPGFTFHHFPGISEFMLKAKGVSWSGIIVDFKTMIKPSSDKVALLGLVDVFPFMRLRLEANNQLSGLVNDQIVGSEHIVEEFFVKAVGGFGLRSLRKFDRKNLVLNIQYGPIVDKKVRQLFRAVSWNVSMRGIFISTPNVDPALKSVALIINELTDKTPIPCRVAWSMPWGGGVGKMPGYGCEILKLTQDQEDELTKLVK